MAFLVSGGASPATPGVMTNGTGSPVAAMTPVYGPSSGFLLAKADTRAHATVVGLLQTDVAAGADGAVQTDGPIVGTTAQWDAVAGTSGGLAAGTNYYLSAATAGRITSTPPSSPGQQLVLIGFAMSSTQLRLMIMPPTGL